MGCIHDVNEPTPKGYKSISKSRECGASQNEEPVGMRRSRGHVPWRLLALGGGSLQTHGKHQTHVRLTDWQTVPSEGRKKDSRTVEQP